MYALRAVEMLCISRREFITVRGQFHSRVFQNIDPHTPLRSASVSFPRNKGGGVHTTHSPGGEGGGGSIFWKMRDTGLASYSANLSTVLVHAENYSFNFDKKGNSISSL